jgi:Family of unknown function (DUF6353)
MNLKPVFKTAQRFMSNNSPAILTGLGVAGAVTTAVLTGKAAFRAAGYIHDEKTALDQQILDGEPFSPMTIRDAVELVWKEFIPPAIVMLVTATAIISANHVSSKRAAALAAAFKISEELANDYRQKVVDSMGKNAEEKMRAELVKERMEKAPGREVIIVSGKNAMFFDEFSGRFFESSMEKVTAAVNQINYQITHSYAASLTDFYDYLDLPKSDMSDEFGWNVNELLEIYHTAVLMNDDTPAIAIRYNTKAFRDYNKIG